MFIVPNCLVHEPSFLSKEAADILMRDLMKECRSDFSEVASTGRSMARYGVPYTYKGRTLKIFPWRPSLLVLRELVQEACSSLDLSTEFNAAVLNIYKNEKVDLPLHADITAIHQLGRQPTIACVSLGAARPFQLVHKKTGQETRIDFSHGDLYIMHGISQTDYLHGAPPVDRIALPRVSITFRSHKE